MIAGLIFVGLAGVTIAFQMAVILGAPWGHLTMGGRWPGRLPLAGRVAVGVSALLVLLMAVILAGRAGLSIWEAPVWAGWVVVGVTSISVIMHIITPSRAERRLWLPVVSVMALTALAVMTG